MVSGSSGGGWPVAWIPGCVYFHRGVGGWVTATGQFEVSEWPQPLVWAKFKLETNTVRTENWVGQIYWRGRGWNPTVLPGSKKPRDPSAYMCTYYPDRAKPRNKILDWLVRKRMRFGNGVRRNYLVFWFQDCGFVHLFSLSYSPNGSSLLTQWSARVFGTNSLFLSSSSQMN